MKKPSSSYRCPCGVTLSLIGGKYKIVILWHLYQKAPVRFNELHRLIPEATTKMFTQQLRELEAATPEERETLRKKLDTCLTRLEELRGTVEELKTKLEA